MEESIKATEIDRQFWEGRAAHCRQALELMRQARPKVLPGSQEELDYVIYKTENFITVFDLLSAVGETKTVFDRAILAIGAGEMAKGQKLLAQTRTAMDRANQLVRKVAEQMIPYAHIPTEKHILYLFNDAIPSHERERNYLAEVIAFHKAQSR